MKAAVKICLLDRAQAVLKHFSWANTFLLENNQRFLYAIYLSLMSELLQQPFIAKHLQLKFTLPRFIFLGSNGEAISGCEEELFRALFRLTEGECLHVYMRQLVDLALTCDELPVSVGCVHEAITGTCERESLGEATKMCRIVAVGTVRGLYPGVEVRCEGGEKRRVCVVWQGLSDVKVVVQFNDVVGSIHQFIIL